MHERARHGGGQVVEGGMDRRESAREATVEMRSGCKTEAVMENGNALICQRIKSPH